MSQQSEFYIQGPISVSYHEETEEKNDKKSIFIFGDKHIRIIDEECKKHMRIDKFLKEIVQTNPNEIYHLFIEGEESQIGDEEKNYLMNVINMKSPSNMKKHFLDIRKMYPSYIAFYTFMSICSGLANTSSITEGQAKYNFELLASLTENFTYKNDLESLYEFFFDTSKVVKSLILPELNKLKNEQLKQHIFNLLLQGVQKYRPGTKEKLEKTISTFLENMDLGMEHFINIFLEKYKITIDKLYDDVAEYGQVLMDAYTLCLILNNEYKNCIVYAGEAHANVLRKFLETYPEIIKVKKLFHNTSEKQCVKFPTNL